VIGGLDPGIAIVEFGRDDVRIPCLRRTPLATIIRNVTIIHSWLKPAKETDGGRSLAFPARRTRRTGAQYTRAGSSRAGLAAMFSSREVPFFHFATPIDLPELGKPFVDHLVSVFRRAAGRTPDRDAMLDAFVRLHRNPHFFRLLVQTMLHDPDRTVGSALDHVRERIAADLGYPDAWLALTPIQRETVRALAMGASRPFSRVFRAALGAALGEEAPSAARVQAALRRLERLGIVDTARGKWEVADPEFGGWIIERP